jgi:hypothetical protein
LQRIRSFDARRGTSAAKEVDNKRRRLRVVPVLKKSFSLRDHLVSGRLSPIAWMIIEPPLVGLPKSSFYSVLLKPEARS